MITFYYLQVLGLGIRVEMINITKLISTTFMPDLLAKHIFCYRGGNSRQVLKSFLEPKSMTFTPGLDQIDAAFLEKYGPGLVSHFSAHDDILVDGRFSFSGEPAGTDDGKHAMVLVGVRVDTEGGRWFLIQNWWRKKQFLEIREDYMTWCEVVMVFVLTPQRSTEARFPTVGGSYAEAVEEAACHVDSD